MLRKGLNWIRSKSSKVDLTKLQHLKDQCLVLSFWCLMLSLCIYLLFTLSSMVTWRVHAWIGGHLPPLFFSSLKMMKETPRREFLSFFIFFFVLLIFLFRFLDPKWNHGQCLQATSFDEYFCPFNVSMNVLYVKIIFLK